jgi:hypothetical protein
MSVPELNLSAWESYYVIVGSSGAALIGLQFVVLTLIAGMKGRTEAATLSAFATPTVVHLTGALVTSAVMSAPWPSLVPAAAVLSLCSLSGLVYGALSFRHARRQSEYSPVWEDWLWFAVLPSVAYLVLALGAVLLVSATSAAPFMVAAAALGLLVIGIHNAWDAVTHLVVNRRQLEKSRVHGKHSGHSRR